MWKLARNVAGMAEVWLCRHLNWRPHSLPILVLMVTDKCQLKCTMCGACDYSPGDHNMLSLEDWKAVVDSAARLNTQIVSITGGEALLRKDLFDLIAHIRGYGMAVHLNSNGLLLNEKNVARIAELGIETVSISLESTDPATHDAIRGKGMFEKTVEGIRKLRRGAPEVRIGVNCVMNRHNLSTLPDMVPWSVEEGVDQIKFAPIHSNLQHKDKPLSDYEDMVFTESDLAGLSDTIAEIRQRLADTNLESVSDRFFDGMTNLYVPPASNFYCYAGYAITVIDAQGNVAACFDKPGMANVRNRPLHEIWRSAEYQQHRKLVRNCETACWDTTNAELSLRLSIRAFLRHPRSGLRALAYYSGWGRRGASTSQTGA
jgi:MoaA/NifB/PqqE/SkfB family radical SAM enzyme